MWRRVEEATPSNSTSAPASKSTLLVNGDNPMIYIMGQLGKEAITMNRLGEGWLRRGQEHTMTKDFRGDHEYHQWLGHFVVRGDTEGATSRL